MKVKATVKVFVKEIFEVVMVVFLRSLAIVIKQIATGMNKKTDAMKKEPTKEA